MLEEILGKISAYREDVDQERIKQAIGYALKSCDHSTCMEACPFEVLEKVMPHRPDDDTILASLLYSPYNKGAIGEEEIRSKFGNTVLNIVTAVNKLKAINYARNDRDAQVEVLRKMFLAMAKDLRAVVVALVYKLGSLKSIPFLDEKKRSLFAKECLDLYAPIAARLGMYLVKTEFEDIAFPYVYPAEYQNIGLQLKNFGKRRNTSIAVIKRELEEFLKSRGVEAEIFGRMKGIYSIYKKMQRKGLGSIDDLFDIFAMRVVIPDAGEGYDNLYRVLGIIHSKWKPISSRFKDYVALPKPNGYRSLHTVVLGLAPKDMSQPVEIQIRSKEMHDEAEYGVASHWLYKQGNSLDKVNAYRDWLLGLHDIKSRVAGAPDILKQVEVDIFKDRIFVLTPRGEVRDLPVGSVPLDFAYAVHTDIGNQCVMAKVNGSIVPLNYELRNGDVVEILTKKESEPKLQWLSFVKTAFAKNKIKNYFSGLNEENNIKEGRRIINEYLFKIGKPQLDQNYTILKNYNDGKLTLTERQKLVEEIGRGGKLVSDVIKKVYPYEEIFVPTNKPLLESNAVVSPSSQEVLVGGESGLSIKFAKCCQPKRGAKIIAYITRDHHVTIHLQSCRFVSGLNKKKILSAEWKGDKKVYRVKIKVEFSLKEGLVHAVSAITTSLGIIIKSVDVQRNKAYFVLELPDINRFDTLLEKLELTEGILSVSREDS